MYPSPKLVAIGSWTPNPRNKFTNGARMNSKNAAKKYAIAHGAAAIAPFLKAFVKSVFEHWVNVLPIKITAFPTANAPNTPAAEMATFIVSITDFDVWQSDVQLGPVEPDAQHNAVE